jgi:hypothetical protein
VLFDVTARPHRQLAAVVLALADDRRDLVVAVVEDVVEQEDGPLDRRQALEHQQERHRERIRVFDVARAVKCAVIGQERLRQPLPDIALAPDPRRAQLVDCKARRDGGEIGLRRIDSARVLERVIAEKRLLDDVLGLGDASEHPVGDREQQWAELLVCLGCAHPPARWAPFHHSRRRGTSVACDRGVTAGTASSS